MLGIPLSENPVLIKDGHVPDRVASYQLMVASDEFEKRHLDAMITSGGYVKIPRSDWEEHGYIVAKRGDIDVVSRKFNKTEADLKKEELRNKKMSEASDDSQESVLDIVNALKSRITELESDANTRASEAAAEKATKESIEQDISLTTKAKPKKKVK